MLQIYNTLARKKEEFVPLEAGKVRLYVCGVTVYDYCHLGHARALLTFDMIYRYLKHLGFEVTFVRNFTDIDDKIIARAIERKISCEELTAEFIRAFYDDTTALGMAAPTVEPKATAHIAEMIDIIRGLEKKKLAYRADGDVFYSVRKFSGYGKLSGKNIDQLSAGARVDVIEAKKDPLDFVLWKAAKPNEPKWASPWGEGRPGWHIECSAMSMKYLGKTFDIHGGGRDLIFPHHENEIAQAEGCTGKTFARYWLHNGFVNINAEKMSKSLDNFLTIRGLLKLYPPEVLRLFVLSAHYRSPLDYAEQNMEQASAGLARYYETKQRIEVFVGDLPASADDCDPVLLARVDKLSEDFAEAMNDDFNTAKVTGMMFEMTREWNRVIDEKRPVTPACASAYLEFTRRVHDVLGIFGGDAFGFLAELKAKAMTAKGLSEGEIERLIVERREARQRKDFKRSDKIRDHLMGQGVQLKDNPDGTTSWTVE